MRCCGNSQDQVDHLQKSREIEEQLKKARRDAESKVKLLLLGTGDSGKSTFLKQMKVLHKNGFSNREIEQSRIVLEENCITSMQRILLSENLKIPKNLKKVKEEVLEAESFNADVAKKIAKLWADPVIKAIYEDKNKYSIQIPSTSPYFFDNAERFAQSDWNPTPEDIFRAKLRTTGINEVSFEMSGVDFTIVDVGGQRSERRKWLHCFDDVTSVIYLTALDEYDMTLEEDNETNRMEESLRLFGEISGSHFFSPASWILFLNKSDLFKEKIKKIMLKEYYKDIPEADSKDFNKACDFMKKMYSDKFQGSMLYTHVTCALDTQNCKRVFSAVADTILMNALNDAGSFGGNTF